ncbi:MAG: hypothetical protein ACKOW9_05960, partial [Candidatus Paceibacterota bacterium]
TWQETDSVLEALILEANLIKEHQPYYNTKEKDDKSFNYVCITKENTLRTIRGKDLKQSNQKFKKTFGPYTNGNQLREALKIIRKFFPYIEDRKGTKGKEEFYRQIKLMPENSKENASNIRNIILFFEGKKKKIIHGLEKEMKSLAKAKQFEDANEIKKKIFALHHINDVALIKSNENPEYTLRRSHPSLEGQEKSVGSEDSYEHVQDFRIEAYDVAHMAGRNMVGVMTVVEGGEINKKEYKKFKIKTQQNANDTGALTEVLERRFNHPEWRLPNLIVVDGGKAQINFAQKVLQKMNIQIPIVSVLKDERHKPKDILGDTDFGKKYEKEILLANAEAHRFSITYHKQMRNKNFLK